MPDLLDEKKGDLKMGNKKGANCGHYVVVCLSHSFERCVRHKATPLKVPAPRLSWDNAPSTKQMHTYSEKAQYIRVLQ